MSMIIAVTRDGRAQVHSGRSKTAYPKKANMRMQAYRFHDRPRLKQGVCFILLGTAGCVAMLIWMLSPTTVSPVPTFGAYLEHAPAGGNVSVRESCPECGVVSSTREIAQAAAAANSRVEVTVRMKDGSSRQFADAGSANWRVGQRMIIIDSANRAGE